MLWKYTGRLQVAIKSSWSSTLKWIISLTVSHAVFCQVRFPWFPKHFERLHHNRYFHINTHLCTSPCTKGRTGNVWENKKQSLQSTKHIEIQYYHKIGSKMVTAKSRKVTQTLRVPYSNIFLQPGRGQMGLGHHSHDLCITNLWDKSIESRTQTSQHQRHSFIVAEALQITATLRTQSFILETLLSSRHIQDSYIPPLE